MDPLTQGTLGAALAQAAPSKSKNVAIAGGLGFASGMAADLDVLIRSSADPFLFLEYHRHFTHSLVFIPLGGLLCALVLHGVLHGVLNWGLKRFSSQRWQLTFMQTFVWCTLGYATHALLDAATSYGTSLFWPFSDERISWSIVPVIDPLFTVPLMMLCLTAVLRQNRKFAWGALAWMGVYLSLGALQHSAALSMGQQLAAERGHTPLRFEVKPSFANILVWKTVYETEQHFHVDAVRAGLGPRIFEGTAVPKLNLARDVPWLDSGTQQAQDIERFTTFSMGFVALDPEAPNRIIDIRYSFVPNEIAPLWSLDLSPDATATDHAAYLTHREDARASFGRLWQMLSVYE